MSEDIAITSKVDFFGEPKANRMAVIDLIVNIDDPHKGLSAINKEGKNALHEANEEYKMMNLIDLYDRQKSERYSFLPHISLGHLRVNYIKYLIKDDYKADEIIKRIKKRILMEISLMLSSFSLKDRMISINKLSIYDLQKRIYIKERTFV